MRSLPDLIIFCPLPPKQNGIADYLAEQLPYLSKKIDVWVVIDNAAPDPTNIPRAVRVLRLAEYFCIYNETAQTPHLYHVGNNTDTEYMLSVLLARPGIVVIHDLNLHYLLELTNIGKKDIESYKMALFNEYGAIGKSLGVQMDKYKWKGKVMPEQLYFNRSIVDSATQIIVHSDFSASHIKALGHPSVSVIPHHLSPKTKNFQAKLKQEYRRELNIPTNKPVLTSLGFIAKAKQIKATLTALAVLKKQGILFTYVLAGACKTNEYDVFQDIADLDLQREVIVTGFLSDDEFFKYLLASDIVINLRYPSGGETSGTLTRAMGLGLSCIVIDIGSFAEIPDDCAVKLKYNESFKETLADAIQHLLNNQKERVELGFRAKEWIENTHDINITSAKYMAIITKAKKEISNNLGTCKVNPSCLNLRVLEFLPKKVLRKKIKEYRNILGNKNEAIHWWNESMLPTYTGESLLVISDSEVTSEIAQSLYEYKPSQIRSYGISELIKQEEMIQVQGVFERFVVSIPVRLINIDPMKILSQLNLLLTISSVGCITFYWDMKTIEHVEFSRNAISTYLEAAGFNIIRTVSASSELAMSKDLPEKSNFLEELCFTVEKVSNMVNINPQPYYSGAYSELKLLCKKRENQL